MKRLLSLCALVALVILAELSAGLTSTQTHAGLVVFDTLPPAAPVDIANNLSRYWIIGQSFLSGPGDQLTSVKALLSSTNLASSGTAQIALWSSNSGELGSMLASQAFADSIITSGSSEVYTFDPTTWTGSVSLAPSTEYWITFTPVTASAVRVWGNFSPDGIGVTNTHYLYGSGATPASGIRYDSSANGTYNMEVQVAVPEPSTCAMALAGLACGGYSLFRRRRVR